MSNNCTCQRGAAPVVYLVRWESVVEGVHRVSCVKTMQEAGHWRMLLQSCGTEYVRNIRPIETMKEGLWESYYYLMAPGA